MSDKGARDSIERVLREGADLRVELIEACAKDLIRAARIVQSCFERGGKVLLFGNGGSAADAQHIAAEFVGRFERDRAPLHAVALTTDTSALTAIANDYGFEQIFARQVFALGHPGDVAIGISTSGRSANVLAGLRAAREAGMITIGFTGNDGGELADEVPLAIVVPAKDTARIQESHIALGHALCELVEESMFAPGSDDVSTPRSNKLIDWDGLLALREQWRALGRVVVWTNGCFDILHIGHVRTLKQARSFGDVLIVGLNGDSSVTAIKGPERPFLPVAERAEMLAALESVDFVVVFNETTPEVALDRLRPDVHSKGADYAPPNGKPVPEAAVVEGYGGRIEYTDLVDDRSTSNIVARIRSDEPPS